MNIPNSRTTRLLEFITALYPWAHGGCASKFCALLGTHRLRRALGQEALFVFSPDIRDPQAYARLFTLVAIALLLLAILGCALVTAAPAAAQQRLRRVCADRGTHCELSLFSAVLHLLKHAPELWDYLIPSAKLNLDISLQNVS